MQTTDSWYKIDNVGELDSPALVVFPARVKHNIQLAIQMVGDVERLRPHVKTHKSPDVARMMIASGISKFKCATIAEAEMLAQCNAKDVLLAYQPIGPKLQRFISLIKNYPDTQFSCLVDNISTATEQSIAFEKNGLIVSVYIDLNVGMNRSGISPDQAVDLFNQAGSLKGIRIVGLHAYDGHIRDANFEVRKERCDSAFKKVEEILDGRQGPIIIAGGSPTFSIHCKREKIECSPGTFIYWDKNYTDQCPEQKFLPAAVLVTRVISLPAPGRICVDLGHKSVAAENEITKRVHFLNATELVPVSQSEEHLVLQTSESHSYKPGDILYGLPFHVCPTVALYERVYTIENGLVSKEWKNIARDRKLLV